MPVTRDWIVACDGSNPDYPWGFACLRCGAKEDVAPRLPVDAYVAWARSFARRHARCVAGGEEKP